MSIHSGAGMQCACGVVIIHQQYHWPHCPANPDRKQQEVRNIRPVPAMLVRAKLAYQEAVLTGGDKTIRERSRNARKGRR